MVSKGVDILIVDDHPAVREGLSLLLSQGKHRVCGEASCKAETLTLLSSIKPDIGLVDLSLNNESGLDIIPDLLVREIPTLIYSMHEDYEIIRRALDHGALGYVTKRETAKVLLEAIQTILTGEIYLGPQALACCDVENKSNLSQVKEQLSKREHQVIILVAKGDSNSEIADKLGVSVRTIETYYLRINQKLGLTGIKELRKYAIQKYSSYDKVPFP